MKLSSFLFVPILACSIALCVAVDVNAEPETPSPLQRRETLAREAVAKDPRSEDAHLKLAEVLSDQGKGAEAQAEVDMVLRMNPNSSSAKLMRDSLKIEASDMSNPDKVKALLGRIGDSLKELGTPDSFDLKSIRQQAEARRSALDHKYSISTYSFPKDPRPAFGEQQKLILDLRMSGDKAHLESELKSQFESYPTSVEARVDYADELVSNGKDGQAEELILEALKNETQHPYLLIMRDGIQAVRSTNSSEQRQAQLRKLSMQMLDARKIRSDVILKKYNR